MSVLLCHADFSHESRKPRCSAVGVSAQSNMAEHKLQSTRQKLPIVLSAESIKPFLAFHISYLMSSRKLYCVFAVSCRNSCSSCRPETPCSTSQTSWTKLALMVGGLHHFQPSLIPVVRPFGFFTLLFWAFHIWADSKILCSPTRSFPQFQPSWLPPLNYSHRHGNEGSLPWW